MVWVDYHAQADSRVDRGDVASDGGENQLDRILEGLREPRARRVLYCLADDEPRSLEETAAAVAARETDGLPTDHQQAVVKTDLYHTVLPRLADQRLIEYDTRSEAVCFRDPSAELVEFLELCRELDTDGA